MTSADEHEGSTRNIDWKTVEGFGEEWAAYTQEELDPDEQQRLFDAYFSVFPFDELPVDSEGFDAGCGTGRWAALVAGRVGRLHCIDPARKALAVARRRLAGHSNVSFHEAAIDDLPIGDGTHDFGYALGVLHHIPDTRAALASCVRKLKPGAPFLVYLYYALENRPAWYRALWRSTDLARRGISKMPFRIRQAITTAIAGTVYLPLARLAKLAERTGAHVEGIPLSSYRDSSFYTLRTDALDRLGTRLEQRFTRSEIESMMLSCGLTDIKFRERPPYWVACGRKAH